MCEAGRIRHHLRNNIGNQKNLVLFIGYCAEGALGDQITKGKSPVNTLRQGAWLYREVEASGRRSAMTLPEARQQPCPKA